MKTTYNLSALLCLSFLLGLGAPVLRAQNGPPAPTGLQASDGEYPDQVALFWNNAEAIFVPGTDPGPGPGPQPEIQITLHAGITISGQTGRRYLIQATPDLAQTNAWTQIGEITLTSATQTWYDPTPARQAQRTYRVIAAP